MIDQDDDQSGENGITLDVELNGVDLHASGDNVYKLIAIAIVLLVAEYFLM